jgi:2-polyprenyl-6-methoxyphenol hydroxylase-like FAD-dependent oxidoreductase
VEYGVALAYGITHNLSGIALDMTNLPQLNHSPAVSKVLIIGGGIGGLTCARACIDAGIEVELYERRSLKSMLSGPGGIFIQRNALRVYELLTKGSLHDELYQRGGTILAGGFFSQTGNPLYINVPQFAHEQDLGVCLLRPELQTILYNSLPEGTVHPERTLVAFEETSHQVHATFQDGSTAEGDVLVGADGLYSQVRTRLQNWEQPEEPIYSGMCCWRGWFYRADLPLSDRYSWAEFWGRGSRFGYFDVGGGRFGFYAFCNAPPGGNDSEAGGSWTVLRSLFADYAEPVPAIIEALKDQPIYRDDIFDRNPLGPVWGKGRVTLIGDAAHPVQPNLGQGGCMAVEDAFELAKLLRTGLSSDDVPQLLRQFEQSRCDRVTRVFNTSRQVGQLGQADTPLGCFLRNWIYKLTPTWLADQQFKWLFDYRPRWES